MSDFTSAQPTPAQLAAANLVEVTTYEEIDAALANGQGPLRSYNATAKNFPPVTTGYVAKPKTVDYTVTFNSEGGSAVSSITVPANTSIEEPVTTRAGFTFDGWFTTGGTKVVFPYVPPASGTLDAQWAAAPTLTFTAAQSGAGQVTVSWSGFSPIEIARNGVDINGAANWNTGPLTDQPTSGTFAFDYLVPGDTYTFTITEGSGVTLSASCEVTASLPELGMNGGGLTWGGDDASNTAAFAQIQKLGGKYVRIAIPWNYSTDPSWTGFFTTASGGPYNTSVITKALATTAIAETYGLEILWLIDGFISSAATLPTAPANLTPGLPYSPQEYAEACAWFVASMKGAGAVTHIEGVNEPDGYADWNGTVPLLASDYAIAMPLVYNQCKAADSTCVVHMAPVANIDQGDSGWKWRTALKAALPTFSEYIDVDAWHFYSYPSNEPPSSMSAYIAAFVAEFVTKPSWITEGGYPSLTTDSGDSSPEMTPALQAEYLPELIQLASGTIVTVFFVYCLQDYGTGSGAGYWGLIDTPPPSGPDADSNQKPSFTAVQSLFGGS